MYIIIKFKRKQLHICNLFILFFLLQLESLRGRLDEREDLLKQKEKKLISVSSEHSENSYAVENLQSILSTKERQITSLKQKVANSFYSYKLWEYEKSVVIGIVFVVVIKCKCICFHCQAWVDKSDVRNVNKNLYTPCNGKNKLCLA